MAVHEPRRSAATGWLAAAGLIGLGAVAAGLANRVRKVRKVAPALRNAALVTVPPMLPPLVPLMRYATQRFVRPVAPAGVRMAEHQVPAKSGERAIRVLRLERDDRGDTLPALVWLHGGGYLIGTPEIDMALLARVLAALDVVIISVDYRLAPKHPFPAAIDDAADALRWVVDNAATLGIDAGRVAVGGNSAGGGLAAALAQWAHDQGIALSLQLLMYPMLDDRTATRTDHAGRGELVWTAANNRYGWRSYLGRAPGGDQLPPYAVPARRTEVAGLAPAWIGVGGLDLFQPEDVAYAERLRAAGVRCTLNVVPDAPHAFDLFNFETPIARAFHADMIAALSAAFTGAAGAGASASDKTVG